MLDTRVFHLHIDGFLSEGHASRIVSGFRNDITKCQVHVEKVMYGSRLRLGLDRGCKRDGWSSVLQKRPYYIANICKLGLHKGARG